MEAAARPEDDVISWRIGSGRRKSPTRLRRFQRWITRQSHARLSPTVS